MPRMKETLAGVLGVIGAASGTADAAPPEHPPIVEHVQAKQRSKVEDIFAEMDRDVKKQNTTEEIQLQKQLDKLLVSAADEIDSLLPVSKENTLKRRELITRQLNDLLKKYQGLPVQEKINLVRYYVEQLKLKAVEPAKPKAVKEVGQEEVVVPLTVFKKQLVDGASLDIKYLIKKSGENYTISYTGNTGLLDPLQFVEGHSWAPFKTEGLDVGLARNTSELRIRNFVIESSILGEIKAQKRPFYQVLKSGLDARIKQFSDRTGLILIIPEE